MAKRRSCQAPVVPSAGRAKRRSCQGRFLAMSSRTSSFWISPLSRSAKPCQARFQSTRPRDPLIGGAWPPRPSPGAVPVLFETSAATYSSSYLFQDSAWVANHLASNIWVLRQCQLGKHLLRSMRVRCYALQHLPFTPLCERSECLRWCRRILSKSPCQAKRSNGGQLCKNTRWGPSVRGDGLQHVLSLRVHENPNGFKRYGRVCRNLPLQFGIATCRKLAQRCWRSKRVFGGMRCAPGVRQKCPLPPAELNGTVPQGPCPQLPAKLRGGTIIGKYRADEFIAPRGELPKHRWGKSCVPCQLRLTAAPSTVPTKHADRPAYLPTCQARLQSSWAACLKVVPGCAC